jgi:hypothetical protein
MHGNITRKTPYVATFISNKLKCHVFNLSFLFLILQNQRPGEQIKSCPEWRDGINGRGELSLWRLNSRGNVIA